MKSPLKSILWCSIFIVCISPLAGQSPELDWVHVFGGSGEEAGLDITVDQMGNVYASGNFSTADNPLFNSAGHSDIFVHKTSSVGNFVWLLQLGADGYDSGTSIKVVTEDGQPYLYVLGYFSETVDFDPGPGTAEFTSHGATDIFLAKYDTDGGFVQAWTFGGLGHDYGEDLAVDEVGNIYITGKFRNSVDFDPGPDTLELASHWGYDIFVQKLDADGNLVFAVSAGGQGHDSGQAIAVDDQGNTIVTGYFSGTAEFAMPDTVVSITSQGDDDAFIWKLDPWGGMVWLHAIGGTGRDRGNAITIDAEGNIYTGGDFSGTVDFDPGPGSAPLTYMALGRDGFIQKLTPQGEFVWARSILSFLDVNVMDLAVDTDGHLFATGYFGGHAQWGADQSTWVLVSEGSTDVFILMLDTAGESLWARSFGDGPFDRGLGVDVDGQGHLYATGFIEGTVDFDPGPQWYEVSSHGGTDFYVLKWKDGIVGVDDIGLSHAFRCYPNPTEGHVTVILGADFHTGQALVHSVDGRLLHSVKYSDQNSLEITMPEASGVYTLTLLNATGHAVSKIVKR